MRIDGLLSRRDIKRIIVSILRYSPVRVEESDVIAESAGAELRVLEEPDHCVLLVIELLRGIEAASVPLTHSHLQEADNKQE